MVIDSIVYDYKWTIDYINELDFYDAFLFYKKIKKREENKAIAELRRIQLLTTAIHTSEPKDFIDSIESSINNEPSEEIVGDLSELEKLKHKRANHGMGVER